MNQTIDYYNANAEVFSSSTADVEFTQLQDKFLALLPTGSLVLDFGCGSGRDAKYFLDQGFQVEATDGSAELCAIASSRAGVPVRHELFSELDAQEVYDGVWACSSILHVPSADLPYILTRIHRALKPNGVLYTSFKHGDFEGVRNGRYFTDLLESDLETLLPSDQWELIEVWQSGDVREGRGSEKWLNLLARKASC